MSKELKSDLQMVDSAQVTLLPNDQWDTIVASVSRALNLQSDAAKEFLRYSLANTLLMDRKQMDYGPGNISMFGTFGCVVRMSDKFQRIVNLFKNRKGKTQNESITDSFRDFSNYAIIAMLVDDHKWPTQ